MENIEIRSVKPKDAKDLLKIYSYYVENTAISFEYVTPSVKEFKKRIKAITKRFPYICLVKDGLFFVRAQLKAPLILFFKYMKKGNIIQHKTHKGRKARLVFYCKRDCKPFVRNCLYFCLVSFYLYSPAQSACPYIAYNNYKKGTYCNCLNKFIRQKQNCKNREI